MLSRVDDRRVRVKPDGLRGRSYPAITGAAVTHHRHSRISRRYDDMAFPTRHGNARRCFVSLSVTTMSSSDTVIREVGIKLYLTYL